MDSIMRSRKHEYLGTEQKKKKTPTRKRAVAVLTTIRSKAVCTDGD